jgi:hypothetical protein
VCLFCAASSRLKIDSDQGYKEPEAVAALVLFAKERTWNPIPHGNIIDSLIALREQVGKNKFQKYLSHFGGLRVRKDRVIKLSQRGSINDVYPVMKIDETTGKMFFLVVEDPGNAMYSTWVKQSMGDRLQELNLSNDETLADMVEALIGICYLAIVYPQHLLKLIPRPHETWNRIETAIWTSMEVGLLDFATKGSKRSVYL